MSTVRLLPWRKLGTGIRLVLIGVALAGLCACAAVPASSGRVSTLAGGSGDWRFRDGPAASATFEHPTRVAVDASGHVYVADPGFNRIRKISPAGVVSTLAGSGAKGSRDGIGADASFDYPSGVAVDASGHVFVADSGNHRIRKITPEGIVSTLAGSGARGFSDGTIASFNFPTDVAVDASGQVFVSDLWNYRIRKITPAGVVSTLAGSGAKGSRDGAGTEASFDRPSGVAVDADGQVYVADAGSNRIRKISPAGLVSTLAGSGVRGFSDGAGAGAAFVEPTDVAADASSNVYVADSFNHRVRKVSAAGVVSTLAGSGAKGSRDGTAADATFSFPRGVAVDAGSHVYVGDSSNRRIRVITP